MNLLDTLTRGSDEEQVHLHPLPKHAAATQAEHLRQHYALLLASVLTAQPEVSEAQTRLLLLLLYSLNLGDIRGQLFTQARELEPEQLLEAARLIRNTGFAHHLIVDTLVLLRLDDPLTSDSVRLVGELATFLGLNETDLATRANDVSEILGLSDGPAEEDANTKEVDSEDKTDIFVIEPYSLAEYWPGRLRWPLTREALRDGLQGELWVLETDMDVDFPWQANDAILVFRNGSTLNTFAKNGAVNLIECQLINAKLVIQGACEIALDRCEWQGVYDAQTKSTAMFSLGQALTVTNCYFITRNARAIRVENNKLTLTNSNFSYCGHAKLHGGAFIHSNSPRSIHHCRFEHCIAARGGALYVPILSGIAQCEFISCESVALRKREAGDVAIYAVDKTESGAISNSHFRYTSLVLEDCGSSSDCIVNTQLQNANIYYANKPYGKPLSKNCTFSSGREIEKVFEESNVKGGLFASISFAIDNSDDDEEL